MLSAFGKNKLDEAKCVLRSRFLPDHELARAQLREHFIAYDAVGDHFSEYVVTSKLFFGRILRGPFQFSERSRRAKILGGTSSRAR